MAEQGTADTSSSTKATTKAVLVDAGTQLILEQGYHQTGCLLYTSDAADE